MPQSPDISRMLVSIKGAESAIRPVANASSQEVRPQEREKFSRLWLQLKAKERKDGTGVEIDPAVVERRDSLWTQSQTDEDLLAEMKGLADLTLGSSKTRDQELAQMQSDYGDDFEPMLMNGLRARAEEVLGKRREMGARDVAATRGYDGPRWTHGDLPIFESDENTEVGVEVRKLWRQVQFRFGEGGQLGSANEVSRFSQNIRMQAAKIENLSEGDFNAINNKLAELWVEAARNDDELRGRIESERRIRPFDAFLDFARKTGGWDGEMGSFPVWLRGFAMKRFFDAATNVYPQSMIVGSRAVTAQLQMGGMFYEQSIGTILDFVPEEYRDFRGVAKEIYDDLKVVSAVHNRERLYAGCKGLPPDKIAETVSGLDERAFQGTESLRMGGREYGILFGIGEVIQGKERFGSTVRKAFALYSLMNLDRADGAITVEELRRRHIALPDDFDVDSAKIVTVQGLQEHVVIENFFPLEKPDQSAEFIETQKNIMARVLVANGAPDFEYAQLAEKIAYNFMEASFVGAMLDRDYTGKEQGYKLLRTYRWRDKYARTSRYSGNPLSVTDFWAMMPTFLDYAKIPASGGASRSMREWILDLNINPSDIPFNQMTGLVDRQYYTDMVGWAARMFAFVVEGTGVTWESLIRGGKVNEEGEPVDEKFVKSLQEMYKYIGYWTACLSVREIGAFFDPWGSKENGGDGKMDDFCARTRLDSGHPNFLPENKFREIVNKKIFRRIVFRELQSFSSKFNSAARVIERMGGKKWGQRLTVEDIERIVELFVNKLSHNKELVEMYGEGANSIFENEKDVLNMLHVAGLLDANFVAMESWRSFIKVGTALNFLKYGGKR